MTTARGFFRSDTYRSVARWVLVLVLIVVAVLSGTRIGGLVDDNEDAESENAAVQSILATACGAASFEDLQKQGLVEECRLAQAGELADAIPDDAASPGDDPSQVDPDVIDDDPNGTPADITPPSAPGGPSYAQVSAAVDDYFARKGIPVTPAYERAIRRATTTYIAAHPPKDGRPPTTREITRAVRDVLLANPPADGSDGRSVASASIDGCFVVFTYSDGTTDRVGPLCGPQGEPAPPPSDAQVAAQVAAYCDANGECRGPAGEPGVVQTSDSCQPSQGEFVTDVSITYDASSQTIRLDCTTGSIVGVPRGS
jgi:hypothetical protein